MSSTIESRHYIVAVNSTILDGSGPNGIKCYFQHLDNAIEVATELSKLLPEVDISVMQRNNNMFARFWSRVR